MWIRVAGLFLVAVSAHAAGPVDFGKAEFDAALAERKLKLRVDTELSLDPPETFRITLYKTGVARVTGGDLRGLMYGLIEAAGADSRDRAPESHQRKTGYACARRPHACARL